MHIAKLAVATATALYMDARSLDDLRNRLVELNVAAQEIQAKADADQRDLTEQETEEIEALFTEFEHVEADIARRERIEAQSARLRRPQPNARQVPPGPPDPDDLEDDDDGGVGGPTPSQYSARASRHREPVRNDPTGRRIQQVERYPGRHGFAHLGEFAQAVIRAAGPGAEVDNRLIIRGAPTTSTREGSGPDGGFAVPPDFRTEIAEKVTGEETLLGRTDQVPSQRNSLVIPTDENSPWDTSGLQAYWADELSQLSQSKANLAQNTLTLNKLTVLVPVSDELLEDAPAMDGYLRRKAPERMNWKINLALVRGDGVGKPLGLLNSPAAVTVAAEAGPQPADTVVPQNILKMHSRMPAINRSRAVWLINQDVEPQLNGMQYAGAGANPNIWPVYLPPGGLSASPFGTLMGRPVVPTEACSILGDAGDIIFADLGQYLTSVKTGGVRVDMSMHLYFDYDAMALRFILRIGGQPWWSKPWSRRDSNSPSLSAYVILGARTGS